MAKMRGKLKNQEISLFAGLTLMSLLLLWAFAPRLAQCKADISKRDAHLKRLNAWINNPAIGDDERAARKVLGLQIYGAVDCGRVGTLDQTVGVVLDADDTQKVVKKATKQHKKHIPFIYHVEIHEYGNRLDDPNLYVTDRRAIVGTRSGAVYEFRWDGIYKTKGLVFTHRKWQKPTIKKQGNAILFFDASQKAAP